MYTLIAMSSQVSCIYIGQYHKFASRHFAVCTVSDTHYPQTLEHWVVVSCEYVNCNKCTRYYTCLLFDVHIHIYSNTCIQLFLICSHVFLSHIRLWNLIQDTWFGYCRLPIGVRVLNIRYVMSTMQSCTNINKY